MAPSPHHTPHDGLHLDVSSLVQTVARKVALSSLLFSLCATCAEPPPTSPPPLPRGVSCAPHPQKPLGVVIAGSGATLPLIRSLARRLDGAQGLILADSIGSSGAVAALVDGAIDVGVTGRALRPAETGRGLVQFALGHSAITFATHISTQLPNQGGDLSMRLLIDLYAGHQRRWRDGRPIRLLVREAGDSGMGIIGAARPDLYVAMETARREARAEVMYTDQEMMSALENIPGAIGPVDASTLVLAHTQARMPKIDGVKPGAEALRQGRWPFTRTQFLLTSDRPSEATAAFVRHVTSEEVADVFAQAGIFRIKRPR